MNNPNVNNHLGSQTVTWDGDTPTLTQNLSPEELAIYRANAGNRLGLGNLAGQGIESLRGLIGSQLDFSGMPGMGNAYQGAGNLYASQMPDIFNSASLAAMPEAYQGAENLPDMPQASEQIRQSVIDAMMSRGNDDFARREEQQNADLVARGLSPGTEAYERERDAMNRARNDYRMQAEISGGQEADRAFGQDLNRRQQGYREQTGDAQLRYAQQMGLRTQGASEQQQRYMQQFQSGSENFRQRGQAAELAMRGQAQGFGQQSELRRQAITELLARRQTPLNEITALMSGSQVSNPFAMPGFAQNSQVAPPPIFGGQQAQGQYGMDLWNSQVGSSNSRNQALGSMASMAMMFF